MYHGLLHNHFKCQWKPLTATLIWSNYITTFCLFDWLTELVMQYWTQLLIAIHLTVDDCVDIVLLFVVYVLMSLVVQPSWLPNPIKVISMEGKAYKLKKLLCWWSIRYQLPQPSIKAYELGLLHAGGGLPCRPSATQLVFTATLMLTN